jgi:hypothetical protein
MSRRTARDAARPAATAGPTMLAGLRVLAVTNPGETADRIRELLGAPGTMMTLDTVITLRLLLAETLGMQHQHVAASRAAARAMNLGRSVNPRFKVIGSGIAADIAACLGLPAAADACRHYRNNILAHDHGNPDRLIVADALATLTRHRQDHGRAEQHLRALHHGASNPRLTVLLGTAIKATQQPTSKQPARRQAAGRLMSPLPGGLVRPHPAQPDLTYLLERIAKIRANTPAPTRPQQTAANAAMGWGLFSAPDRRYAALT